MTNYQPGFTIWLTGLSGAGKTTIGVALERELKTRGVHIERLDGDTVREGLTRDLGFSKEDRDKNIERVTFVAKLLSRNGVGVIASFISPYREARQKVREQATNFIEVFVSAPLEVCAERDVKGLYAKALAGEIKGFTGIDDPYEIPENAEIVAETDQETPEESVQKIISYLETHALIPGSTVVQVNLNGSKPSIANTWTAILPHGGTLINRIVPKEAHADAAERATTLEKIVLSDLNLADLEMIATGGLSPLTGYMGQADYQSVVQSMRLANGLPWTIPVTLAVSVEQAERIESGAGSCAGRTA